MVPMKATIAVCICFGITKSKCIKGEILISCSFLSIQVTHMCVSSSRMHRVNFRPGFFLNLRLKFIQTEFLMPFGKRQC
jgi:hypothetical protein